MSEWVNIRWCKLRWSDLVNQRLVLKLVFYLVFLVYVSVVGVLFEFILIVEELLDGRLGESEIASCCENEGFDLLKQVFSKHDLCNINELKDLQEVWFSYSISASYHYLVGIQKLSFFLVQGNLYRIELFDKIGGLLTRDRFEPMVQMIE